MVLKRSRTYPTTPARPTENDVERRFLFPRSNVSPDDGSASNAALVRNIASFLTLSDAASLVSFTGNNHRVTPADSWAVGEELNSDHHRSWSFGSLATPVTPALVALSPDATPNPAYREHRTSAGSSSWSAFVADGDDRDGEDDMEDRRMEELLEKRRRRWAQEKITTAIFSHQRSLRSYCWDAYMTASDIRMQKEHTAVYTEAADENSPETHIEPTIPTKRMRRHVRVRMDLRTKVVHEVIDWIFHRVPLSVLLDVLEAGGSTTVDTVRASFTVTITIMNHAITALGHVVHAVWDTLVHCVTNPFQVLEAIISLQFNAMGKTSEVLVSGIQSVATGVGSASSLALYRFSATTNMSSSQSLSGHANRKSAGSIPDVQNKALNKRLLKKLSCLNDTGLVVRYREREDKCSGLTRLAVSKTRRQMHYLVSLRPFVATVSKAAAVDANMESVAAMKPHERNDLSMASQFEFPLAEVNVADQRESSLSPGSEDDGSPFMLTPHSFPPTPQSRGLDIAQRSQMSDDIVFLARDRLRIFEGRSSGNETTRARSQVLEEARRLAIFSCNQEGGHEDTGIKLTCGRHIATKVGNVYYASARSMIPILRNYFMYFEMTVLPQQRDVLPNAHIETLSIGLSTKEMPSNTLVGAWQGSVGLCTTGQILMAGQWCSPADPAAFAYGAGATVGCLVCFDEKSAIETWDGVMVKTTIRFLVNGVPVSPPVSSLPLTGEHRPLAHANVGSPISLSGSAGSTSGASSTNERYSPSPATLNSPPATLCLLVPIGEELFPTVTIQSSNTSVVCRFSAEDVLATTREMIGAPPDVAVYGVDGSCILEEGENTFLEEYEDDPSSLSSRTSTSSSHTSRMSA